MEIGETMPCLPGALDGNGTGPVVSDIGQIVQVITLVPLVAVVPNPSAPACTAA